MIRGLIYISVAAMGALVLGSTPAGAQQQPSDTQQQPSSETQQGQQPLAPIPAIRSPLASAADNGDADETPGSQQLTPDTRSLTGVEDLSLGSKPLSHSYWQPFLSFSVTGDSNPDYAPVSDWGTWTSFYGGVDVHKTSSISDMSVGYLGGGMFSDGGAAQNGVIQQLNFKDKFTLRRSTFSVFEQLGYLPESSFGFAGLVGAGIPGEGGSGLGTTFTAGQSILTPRGQNLTSTTALEWDTRLSPRTTLTFVGDYGLYRYFENGLSNSGNATFQAGYNYQLTRKDTIAFSYLFGAFRYSNANQSINSNTIQGSYGRRITGRLAFQIAAGPQFTSSTSPITGSGSPSGSSSASASSVNLALNSSLQFQLRRALLSATYSHGVTGGSGVLAGAETNVVFGSVSGQVTRKVQAMWNAGYSRNDGFAVGTSSAAQIYNYWFTGVNVSHTFGRSLDMFMNYEFQYQDNSTNGCVGTACSANVTRNQVAFGMNLHKQPIPF
jgi:hypothetical protein